MKVALLGAWHVHAADYTRKALEMGEMVGFYERDDALAEAFGKAFGIPRFETREALLGSCAEGVIVCSATRDHAEDILAVARAKKQIFTEKVLALTDEDCDKIEAALEENGVSLTISLFQKYLGSRMAVKEIADSGELGKINYLRFRNCHSGSTRDWLPPHFYNREQCGGGAMIDLGAHGMYLIDWLLGEPQSYQSAFTHACRDEKDAILNPDGIEDNAVTVMTYEDGTIAINETGFVSDGAPVLFEIGGEEGYLLFDGEKAYLSTLAEGKVELELPAPVALPIERFIKGEDVPGCGMAEAIALTRMMEGAYAD